MSGAARYANALGEFAFCPIYSIPEPTYAECYPFLLHDIKYRLIGHAVFQGSQNVVDVPGDNTGLAAGAGLAPLDFKPVF